MSRILLTLLIICSFSVITNAQFTKGSVLLGGQLSFSSSKTESPVNAYQNQKTNNGLFDISIGKAIKDNAVFGLDVSYNPSSINNYYYDGVTSLDYSNNGYSIGVFYRIYKNLGKDFFLFGQAGAAYIGSTKSGKSSSGEKVLTGSSSGGSAYFMPGIAYMISKKFFLELTIPDLFSVNYSSQNTTYASQKVTTDQFDISTSLSSNPITSLAIGFRLVL